MWPDHDEAPHPHDSRFTRDGRNHRAAGLRQALDHERAERAKLAAELAEARKPALVRLVEALRRR